MRKEALSIWQDAEDISCDTPSITKTCSLVKPSLFAATSTVYFAFTLHPPIL